METFRAEVFQLEVLDAFWPKCMRYLVCLPRLNTQGFSDLAHFIYLVFRETARFRVILNSRI